MCEVRARAWARVHAFNVHAVGVCRLGFLHEYACECASIYIYVFMCLCIDCTRDKKWVYSTFRSMDFLDFFVIIRFQKLLPCAPGTSSSPLLSSSCNFIFVKDKDFFSSWGFLLMWIGPHILYLFYSPRYCNIVLSLTPPLLHSISDTFKCTVLYLQSFLI